MGQAKTLFMAGGSLCSWGAVSKRIVGRDAALGGAGGRFR